MQKTTKKRLLIWGAISLLVVVLIVIMVRPQPVLVDIVTVNRAPLQVTLDQEGKTRVHEKYVVSAPVTGQMSRITLEAGDPVMAGETILTSFQPSGPTLLDVRTRAEAQAKVKSLRASLITAMAQAQRAKVAADLADKQLTRLRRLREAKVISQEALDQAEANASSRHDELNAAEAAINTTKYEIKAAQATLLVTTAPKDSKEKILTLRSPVTGVVLRLLRQSEAVVPIGEPLLEIANTEKLEIVADYLSSDAVKIRPGMTAIIEQWGGGQAIKARVRRVDPSGFMKVSALGVEEQRVWVVLDFEDPYEAWKSLGDGFRVEVRVVTWQENNVLQVPTSALFRQAKEWRVFVYSGERAHLKRVEIGERNNLAAQVRSGLAAGEKVIIHPAETVSDGVQVTEREK